MEDMEDMEDMEGTEEGPVPLDDGPLEDEVLEDMDGGFDNLFVSTFVSQIQPPRGRLISYLQMLQLEISISRSHYLTNYL